MTPEQAVEVRVVGAALEALQRCGECGAASVGGTGYCASHLGPARVRACEEIRASYGMWGEDGGIEGGAFGNSVPVVTKDPQGQRRIEAGSSRSTVPPSDLDPQPSTPPYELGCECADDQADGATEEAA